MQQKLLGGGQQQLTLGKQDDKLNQTESLSLDQFWQALKLRVNLDQLRQVKDSTYLQPGQQQNGQKQTKQASPIAADGGH